MTGFDCFAAVETTGQRLFEHMQAIASQISAVVFHVVPGGRYLGSSRVPCEKVPLRA